MRCAAAVLGAALWLGAPAAHAAPSAGEAPYRDRIEEILSRREFRSVPRSVGLRRPRVDLPEIDPRWMERLAKRLQDIVRWLAKIRDRLWGDRQGGGGGLGLGTWVLAAAEGAVWVLGIGAAAILAILVVRLMRRVPRAGTDPALATVSGEEMPDALSRSTEAWRRFAEEFVRKGEWRLALRAVYLALLSLLHERGAIRYARDRTNGEYAAALASVPAGEPFQSLTGMFDRAWYGDKPFAEEGYDTALDLARRIDGAVPPSPAGPGGARHPEAVR